MPQEIAVSIDPLSDNNRGMLRGVIDYVAEQPQLRVFKVGAVPYVSLQQLRGWRGAGVVAVAETTAQQQQLLKLKRPKVCVSLHLKPPPSLPTVHSDNRAIGKLAADHLRELGLTRFAFVGHSRWQHNVERLAGFTQALKEHRHDCETIDVDFAGRRRAATHTADLKLQPLARRLKSLTYPIGIFAAHDEFAHDVVETLRELNLQVPYDAAVVGVNNYRLICETSNPPLTSIAQSAHQIGYTAAKLLHELIEGRRPPKKPILVPPGGLIARRSSDYSAVDDPLVLRAMDFIRAHCGEPITAADVVERASVARRTLDKRFAASIGHPIAEELRLARIKKARELLLSTDMQVLMVGLSCGYNSPSGFVRAFREATGQTPQQFRQQSRHV